MRSLVDASHALNSGLDKIRTQFDVPQAFPAEVLDAARAAAGRSLSAHVDRTGWPFVTLDPAASTDLDQAFHIEASGNDLLLHYAIADVAWFVDDGGLLDAQAWARGETIYLPDAKASLYPADLAEGAASLLPDGPRPAVVFSVRIDGEGLATLAGAERAVVRSTAKLAYDAVDPAQLPAGFAEIARRITLADERRGASRVEPPEQHVEEQPDGTFRLGFRPRLASEEGNAALSLATNLAIAAALLEAGTGLFRVMPEPDDRAVRRLRHTARALDIDWPANVTLAGVERGLDPTDARHAAFMMAIRRAAGGATYEPYTAGVRPWHSAMAATYVHATAPLRRLADRYVVRAALAVANNDTVPPDVAAAFTRLPAVMEAADTKAAQVERAVVDLAEAVVLRGAEGRTFPAVVTDVDERGARIQVAEPAVVTRVGARGVEPGDDVRVKLLSVDVDQRLVQFERVA